MTAALNCDGETRPLSPPLWGSLKRKRHIMTDENTPFIDYWDQVDDALLKFFGIDTWDAGIEPDLIASAQDAGDTPEDFAKWFGVKYDLTHIESLKEVFGIPSEDRKTRKIAFLNDMCRRAMGVAGRLVQTSGICALSQEDQSAIREKVETFDAFTPDNDPHEEHDFGAFEHNGERIFWKIDYYDTTMTRGSEDPSDPQQTIRVLTIMFASEY